MYHGRNDNLNPKETGHVILFVADRDRCYAKDESSQCWVLNDTLPTVPDFVIEFAAEFYGVTVEDIEPEVNPDDIVDTAGVWDDAQFISELWEKFGDDLGIGFATPDGAVVIDPIDADITRAD